MSQFSRLRSDKQPHSRHIGAFDEPEMSAQGLVKVIVISDFMATVTQDGENRGGGFRKVNVISDGHNDVLLNMAKCQFKTPLHPASKNHLEHNAHFFENNFGGVGL